MLPFYSEISKGITVGNRPNVTWETKEISTYSKTNKNTEENLNEIDSYQGFTYIYDSSDMLVQSVIKSY